MNPKKPWLININEKDIQGVYVYRIFTLDKFLDIFSQKDEFLTFVKPRLWDDPFENFLLKNLHLKFKDIDTPHEKLHGHCWSLNEDTDFMWRVYAPNKDGIKVKVKLETIINDFVEPHYDKKKGYCFIGKVKYEKWEKIKEYYESTPLTKIFSDSSNHSLALTLLRKRKEFKPEQEVRMIYWPEWAYGPDSETIRLGLNANKIFEEVVIDPRITDTNRIDAIKNLIKKVGFTGGFSESQLYSEPNLKLNFS